MPSESGEGWACFRVAAGTGYRADLSAVEALSLPGQGPGYVPESG